MAGLIGRLKEAKTIEDNMKEELDEIVGMLKETLNKLEEEDRLNDAFKEVEEVFKEELVIGETYEFSDCKEFSEIDQVGELLSINNDSEENKYWCKINEWEAQAFDYIRPVQKEGKKDEPRFIETNIIESTTEDENKNGFIKEYVCEPPSFIKNNFTNMNINSIPIPIDSVFSLGAIGFKFEEHPNVIYNSPVGYMINDKLYFSYHNVSLEDSVKVIRANKVVWLNPNYNRK